MGNLGAVESEIGWESMKIFVLLLVLAISVLVLGLPALAVEVCLDTGAPIDSAGNITVDYDALAATGTKYVRINFILYPWYSPLSEGMR